MKYHYSDLTYKDRKMTLQIFTIKKAPQEKWGLKSFIISAEKQDYKEVAFVDTSVFQSNANKFPIELEPGK